MEGTERSAERPTRVGIVGTGLMAGAHASALRRLPGVVVTAVAGSSPGASAAFAAKHALPLALGHWRELVGHEQVDVVHNCTPTGIHTEVNLATIAAGRHLLCEKPLATSSVDAAKVVDAARASGLVTGVAFNYRSYSAVRYLRSLLASGELGPVHQVHGGYLQDWLSLPSDWNWRLDADLGGPSTVMADIGSHWFDLVEYVVGDEVATVCADLGTVHPVRHPALGGSSAVRRAAGEVLAGVLARTAGGIQVSSAFSQVSPGSKNRLHIQVDAAQASLSWNQEVPNQLHIGRRERPSELWERGPVTANPALLALPPGHPEGWIDALTSLCSDFHASVSGGVPTHPSLADGLRAVAITEAVLASHAERAWMRVEPTQLAGRVRR
ncbi:MAG: dehydrogenase [Acidimicrobiaceae bacterium]|nr:dehydrogenase [Acidimicrobiaceae bacterium]